MATPDILAQRFEALVTALTTRPRSSHPLLVNDVHSKLNATSLRRIVAVRNVEDARGALIDARAAGASVCIAGGWHAMGGQQFATDGVLLDTRQFRRVLNFDQRAGTIEVEAGIQWPELVEFLCATGAPWGIAQKQTGADRLSIGGAVSANVHGRGLAMRPFVGDIEALTLMTADGRTLRCARDENADLFRLVVGGYGLFGFIVSVTLRLAPRCQLRRVVEVITADTLMKAFDDRIRAGFLYGDFQFDIDPASPEFLHRGVFSTYEPIDDDVPIPADQRAISDEQWRSLLLLAHVDKSRAFELYAEHYLSTSGQRYWSDTHQLTTYIDDYHVAVDTHLQRAGRPSATEMITELYVPPARLVDFLAEAREDFRRHQIDLVYGTIRLTERDDETFLPWARDRSACVIFNLHTEHTPAGLTHAADAFRRLIDMAISRGGSYYLTYHRHARRDQVIACHPRFPDMLSAKRRYDPEERFQSDWYRWYRAMFAE